jgi:hypothetical protein
VTDAVSALIDIVSRVLAVHRTCELLETYRTTLWTGTECRMTSKQKRLTLNADQSNSNKICNDAGVTKFEELLLEGMHQTA